MKRLLAMFVLTPREQRLVTFVVVGMVFGVWIKDQGETKIAGGPDRNPTGPTFLAESPSPNQLRSENSQPPSAAPSFQSRDPTVADK